MNDEVVDIFKLSLAVFLIVCGIILLLAFVIWGATALVATGGFDIAPVSYLKAVFKSIKVVLGIGIPCVMLWFGYCLLK